MSGTQFLRSTAIASSPLEAHQATFSLPERREKYFACRITREHLFHLEHAMAAISGR
jgi:hypothetical protein